MTTIKEILKYWNVKNFDNIEVVVWHSANNHKTDYNCYPHPEYCNNLGSTELGSLKVCNNKLQTDGSEYININQEFPDNAITTYALDQKEYYEWDRNYCPDVLFEDEPKSTLLIAVDPICVL